nr:cubilin-like [Penaeus vannamei]
MEMRGAARKHVCNYHYREIWARLLPVRTPLLHVVLAGGTPDGKRVKDPSEARLKDLQLRYFTDCGGNFKLNAGQCKEITSPRFPKNYRRNSRCPWKFQANNSSTPIIISCNVFNLQKSKNCKKDNVILADGGKNKIIACGEKRSLFWRSDTGSLDVFFKSNFFWQKQGFNARFVAVVFNTGKKFVAIHSRIIGGAPTRINEYPGIRESFRALLRRFHYIQR